MQLASNNSHDLEKVLGMLQETSSAAISGRTVRHADRVGRRDVDDGNVAGHGVRLKMAADVESQHIGEIDVENDQARTC